MDTSKLLGKTDEILGVTCNGLASHPGGVAILPSLHAPPGGKGVLKKVLYGEAPPEVQPLTIYIPFFQKRHPFRIPFIGKRHPFHIPSYK